MPDLCKLMTSTFILFRSPSLLYQTANFLNWRLFKMKSAVTLLLSERLVTAGCHASGYRADQWATRKHYWFQEKKRMLLVFSTATGHVFVSTESTIGYIIEACTIGLIVKVSSFWLVYGWTIYIYNNILKKAKGICDPECFCTQPHLFSCFMSWFNN